MKGVLIFICGVLVLTVGALLLFPSYKIEQTVKPMKSYEMFAFQNGLFGDVIKQSNSDHEKYGDLMINTYVWHRGDIIKSWNDVANDTIKCYRYHEARDLIQRIKFLNKPCK
jgi:hypothetical protein